MAKRRSSESQLTDSYADALAAFAAGGADEETEEHHDGPAPAVPAARAPPEADSSPAPAVGGAARPAPVEPIAAASAATPPVKPSRPSSRRAPPRPTRPSVPVPEAPPPAPAPPPPLPPPLPDRAQRPPRPASPAAAPADPEQATPAVAAPRVRSAAPTGERQQISGSTSARSARQRVERSADLARTTIPTCLLLAAVAPLLALGWWLAGPVSPYRVGGAWVPVALVAVGVFAALAAGALMWQVARHYRP